MAYSKSVLTLGATGSEIVTTIKSIITAADSGWTLVSGETYQSISGGVTYTITFTNTVPDVRGNIGMVVQGVDITLLTALSTVNGALVGLEVSAAPDFLYIRVQGPAAGGVGATDATYGSPTSFVMLTPIIPYVTTDNVAADLVAVVASTRAAATSLAAYSIATNPPVAGMSAAVVVKRGTDGTTNKLCELGTMRPAVQDVVALGDLFPGKALAGGLGYWPLLVFEALPLGARGRLKNVAFGGDNYNIGDDVFGQLASSPDLVVNGDNYVLTQPAYFPCSAGGAQGYSPLGQCKNATSFASGASAGTWSTVCGPNIIIKKGSGA